MNKADTMIRLATVRQIDLQRVATGMLTELLVDLGEIKEEAAIIAFRLDPADVTRVSAKRDRVARMQEEIEELVDRVLREMSRRAESDFKDIEALLEEDNRNNFAFVYGLGLAFADAGKPTIQGLPVRDHFDRIASDLSFRLGISIRDAWEGAGTAEEIARRIRLETEFGRSPVDQSASAVETTVRTGIDDIPSRVETRGAPVRLPAAAVPEGVEPSPISPHGWQHISVLDRKTCFAKGTMVETPSGGVPIDKIEFGQTVIGGSGVTRKVLGTSKARTRKIALITLDDGTVMRCTPDHLFLCTDLKWREARHLEGFALATRLESFTILA